MRPAFEVPTNVVTFADRDAFIAFLDQQQIPYHAWKQPNPQEEEQGTLERVWNEIKQKDTLITTAQAFGLPFHKSIVRHIRTATARITYTPKGDREKRTLLLEEYKVRKGIRNPRKYSGSSLSEKLTWDLERGKHELPVHGLLRAFREELGITVDEADLSPGVFTRMVMHERTTVVRGPGLLPDLNYLCPEKASQAVKRNIDLDIHFMDEGLITHNQVVHYAWQMPDTYFQNRYVNSMANYVSEWRSVHESILKTGTE